MQMIIYPPNALINDRVNDGTTYDDMILACIENIEAFGLHKTYQPTKNVLGELDNKTLWTIFSAIVIVVFWIGYYFNIIKLNRPDGNQMSEQHKTKEQQLNKIDSVQTLKSQIDSTKK
jgi:hypothetical protein